MKAGCVAVLAAGLVLVALAPSVAAEAPGAGLAIEERPEPWFGSYCYATLAGEARCNVEGREARAWGLLPHDAACDILEAQFPPGSSAPVPELDRRLWVAWIGAGIVYVHTCNPPYAGVAFEQAVGCATRDPTSCLSGACTLDYPSSSCNLGPVFWGHRRR